jgi:hypothetical protein
MCEKKIEGLSIKQQKLYHFKNKKKRQNCFWVLLKSLKCVAYSKYPFNLRYLI